MEGGGNALHSVGGGAMSNALSLGKGANLGPMSIDMAALGAHVAVSPSQFVWIL